MKKFIEEFKAFVMRGNVMDMAVGVIVGGAFGAITTSLVSNVVTPLLAVLFNSPNPDALNITLRAADEAAGTEAIVLGLGTFVGAIINFLVIALVLFSVIKAMNKAKAHRDPGGAEGNEGIRLCLPFRPAKIARFRTDRKRAIFFRFLFPI